MNADGATCTFTLTCNAGKEAHVGYAELVKTQLEQFGIQVVLETLDADSYNAKTSNKFSENNVTMEAAIYGFTAAGMGMKNGLASIYVDGTHPVQGGCQVFDEEFQAILSTMGEAKTVEEYTAAAGSLQDWYAAHTPLIALYWDSQILVHSAAYENFTVDAVFGLNNAKHLVLDHGKIIKGQTRGFLRKSPRFVEFHPRGGLHTLPGYDTIIEITMGGSVDGCS